VSGGDDADMEVCDEQDDIRTSVMRWTPDWGLAHPD